MLACVKREMDKEEIENIINNLEAERSTDKNEISSKQIGNDILRILKTIDPVAYVRFASVYKSFDNLEDFKKYVE
jgi:transcriptional repressor NrdR